MQSPLRTRSIPVTTPRNRITAAALAACVLLTALAPSPARAEGDAGIRSLPGVPYGEHLLRNLQYDDLTDAWSRGAILRMSARNVLHGRGEGSFRPLDSVSRQEAVVLFGRLAADPAQEALEKAQKELNGVPLSLDEWAKDELPRVMAAGIVTIDELRQTNWKKDAERQEVARWAARAAGLSAVRGNDQQAIYNFRDWKEIKRDYKPYVESVVGARLMEGEQFCDNYRINCVKFFRPEGTITRQEIAVLADRLTQQLPPGPFQSEAGQVVRIQQEVSFDRLGTIQRTFTYVRTRGGEGRRLIAEARLSGDAVAKDAECIPRPGQSVPRKCIEVLRDAVVDKAGQLGLMSGLLAQGDQIEYLIRGGNEVVFVRVLDGAQTGETLSGTLQRLDLSAGQLALADAAGNIATLKVAGGANVTIYGRPARLVDLLPGFEVTLKLAGNEVIGITVENALDQPGYLPPGRRTVTGRVRYIEGDRLSIVDAGGREQIFTLGDRTQVVQAGRPGQRGDLRPGDAVVLSFDGATGDTPARIDVERRSGAQVAVYRARLAGVLPTTGEVLLEAVERWDEGVWRTALERWKLAVDGAASLYQNGARTDLNRLRTGAGGQTAYLAVEQRAGQPAVVKLAVQPGETRDRNGPISSVTFTRSELVLENEPSLGPVALPESTIIVRDGRLVDPTGLDSGSHAFVAATGPSGAAVAAVVSQEALVPAGLRIFYGQLVDPAEESFELRYHSELRRNEWAAPENDSDDRRTVAFTGSTDLWDAGATPPGPISIDNFRLNRYSGLYNYRWLNVLVRDDRALAALLLPGEEYGLRSHQVAIGTVQSVDLNTGRVTIDQVKDWSALQRRWEPNAFALTLTTSDALIAGGDGALALGRLQVGDRLYAVHDGPRALLLIRR